MNAHASRFAVSTFILQTLPDTELPPDTAGVGYTATKKLGGAVVRNRIKRRLREAFRQVAPKCARAQHNYVFIARHKALSCDFAELVRDMEFAISRIGTKKTP